MSITYCHNCNHNIDTDLEPTHIEDCKGEDGLEHLKKRNKKPKKIEYITKREVKVAINNAFSNAFNGYVIDGNLDREGNIKYNLERVRERLTILHKSINRMKPTFTLERSKVDTAS